MHLTAGRETPEQPPPAAKCLKDHCGQDGGNTTEVWFSNAATDTGVLETIPEQQTDVRRQHRSRGADRRAWAED
jgi:hypothetical protein